MEVIYTVGGPGVSTNSVVGNISFGVEIDNISGWINRGSANDSNIVRNICSMLVQNSKPNV